MGDDDQDEIIESADVIVALLTENARLKRELEEAKGEVETCDRALREVIKHEFDRAEYAEARLATLESAFLHTHQVKVDGELGDECRWCKLDIQNIIHRRVDDESRTSWIELALTYADVSYAALNRRRRGEG